MEAEAISRYPSIKTPYKYRVDMVEDEFGGRQAVSTPTHRIYNGRWEMNFDVQIYSESHSELEELVDITSMTIQYTLWNELRKMVCLLKV